MLSSGPGLLSRSHAGCAQFIGPVSTNRHASHSIAKSVLIGVQFLFYVSLLMVTPSYCFPELLRLPSPPSPFSAQFFCCPLYHSPFIKPVFILVSCFSGSPTSASSHCGSGEGGSQSGENAPAEVCVSWWKPSSQSPLDQGKSSPPSVVGALWRSVAVTKMSHFSVRTYLAAPYGTRATTCTHCCIFFKTNLHPLVIRTGRFCPPFGRKTLWSRSRPAFFTWRSPPRTTRRRCAARASTRCPHRLCPSAASSRCSVSENNG